MRGQVVTVSTANKFCAITQADYRSTEKQKLSERATQSPTNSPKEVRNYFITILYLLTSTLLLAVFLSLERNNLSNCFSQMSIEFADFSTTKSYYFY